MVRDPMNTPVHAVRHMGCHRHAQGASSPNGGRCTRPRRNRLSSCDRGSIVPICKNMLNTPPAFPNFLLSTGFVLRSDPCRRVPRSSQTNRARRSAREVGASLRLSPLTEAYDVVFGYVVRGVKVVLLRRRLVVHYSLLRALRFKKTSY